MSVVRRHDGQGNLDSLVTELVLEGQNVVDVIMHEPFSGEEFEGNGHFDAWVAESLSETTSHQHEGCVIELFQTDSFVFFDLLRLIQMERDTIGLADVVVFVRVD